MKKEIKIGVFVLVTFILLIWGFNYLKGRDIFFRGNKYYGVFAKVDGLNDASPIYYHGFKIGTVRNIDIDQSNGDRFIVTFATNKDLLLPKNSVAQIYSLDLLGSKAIQFIKGNSKEYLKPNDTLSTSIVADLADQLSTNVLPLKDKTEKLISRFDTVLAQASFLFREANVKNINNAIESFSASMDNLQELTASLAKYAGEGGNLQQTTHKLDMLLDNLNRQGTLLDTTMSALASVSGDLKRAKLNETLLSLKATLQQTESIMHSINDSEGSLGMLINDKSIYNSLANASANLDRLLVDIRYNPKRYVSFSAFDFGKKNYYDASLTSLGLKFWVKLSDASAQGLFDNKSISDQYTITEFYDGKNYLHLIGESSNYADAIRIKEQIVQQFPNSEVIAIENHKVMPLKKALKKINK
jgi:phospholipid/cholesterol/gamma-HCH transport system substrate-binding protein